MRKFRTTQILLSVGALTFALTRVSQHAAAVEITSPKVPPPKIATTVLCAGDAAGSGAGSWTRSRLPMIPPCK